MERRYSLYTLVLLLTLLANGKGNNNECPSAENSQILYDSKVCAENIYCSFRFPLPRFEQNAKDIDLRLEIKLCDDGSQHTACRCWWIATDDPVCKSQYSNWTCHADHSEMQFALPVQRTHSDLMWVLFKQNSTPYVLKHTTLQVTYLSKITGLQVNGKEVNSTYLADENQEVTISCFFTRGHPLESIRIVDENGQTLSSTKHSPPLVVSLGVFHCHSDWPTVRCEAPGSEHNRSVSVFVRCPPQLSYVASQDLNLRQILAGDLTVAMKSYTSDIQKCVMSRQQPKATSREVKCQVSGCAPKFSLTLGFHQEVWIGEGIWTLQVMSELGASSITFQLTNSTEEEMSLIKTAGMCFISVTDL